MERNEEYRRRDTTHSSARREDKTSTAATFDNVCIHVRIIITVRTFLRKKILRMEEWKKLIFDNC